MVCRSDSKKRGLCVKIHHQIIIEGQWRRREFSAAIAFRICNSFRGKFLPKVEIEIITAALHTTAAANLEKENQRLIEFFAEQYLARWIVKTPPATGESFVAAV